MSDETFVKITIEPDTLSKQEGVSLKIELEEDTQVEELLDYLSQEGKLNIPKELIVVENKGGGSIPFGSHIGDYAHAKKVDLTIRRKEAYEEKESRKDEKKEIAESNFDIPKPGEAPNVPYNEPAPAYNSPAPQKETPQHQQPAPAQKAVEPAVDNKKGLTLIIAVEDGETKIKFEFPTAPESTFRDIMQDIHKHIIDKKLLDNWTLTEEIKVMRGGNIFKKETHAFGKLGVPNKAEFTIIRAYPGGGK